MAKDPVCGMNVDESRGDLPWADVLLLLAGVQGGVRDGAREVCRSIERGGAWQAGSSPGSLRSSSRV
jgi:hypothetical protein